MGLLGLRAVAEFVLESVNDRHVQAHAGAVPEAFREFMDMATYRRSVDYTLARGRLARIEILFETLLAGLALGSGALPWSYQAWSSLLGASVWGQAAYVVAVGLVMAAAAWPLQWYAQFRVEERFGFRTITAATWWADRVKGLVLGMVLGTPLLALLVWLVEAAGDRWWLWGWGAVMGFQLLMAVLAPVVILPWFNRLTPLADGSLKERLLALAKRTAFRARGIQVMDGSRRSRHSNAFFTGFGRFRRIVLFDTLIGQLTEPEVEAVLAHEIGHAKRRHTLKLLAGWGVGLLAGLYVLAWLAQWEVFHRAFGFVGDDVALVFLVFGLLSGAAGFWVAPLVNALSRRFEYEADAYAAKVLGDGGSLIAALRRLTEKNLGNLTPHPLYSGFHYSHPTLLERERALRRGA